MKKKSAEYSEKQKEKAAKSKGFSSAKSYEFYKGTAQTEGEELAKSELRKKELKRIKNEAREDVILGRMGKYNKIQKKVKRGFDTFEKGAGVYNEIMGGLQSMGSGNDSYFSKPPRQQNYYAKPKRRKSTQKKTKPKRKSKPKQNDFWSQFNY